MVEVIIRPLARNLHEGGRCILFVKCPSAFNILLVILVIAGVSLEAGN